MTDAREQYQMLRSHGDIHVFVICYADCFYDDVPKDVRDKGPWRGHGRGEVVNLKAEIRLALARDGYVHDMWDVAARYAGEGGARMRDGIFIQVSAACTTPRSWK